MGKILRDEEEGLRFAVNEFLQTDLNELTAGQKMVLMEKVADLGTFRGSGASTIPFTELGNLQDMAKEILTRMIKARKKVNPSFLLRAPTSEVEIGITPKGELVFHLKSIVNELGPLMGLIWMIGKENFSRLTLCPAPKSGSTKAKCNTPFLRVRRQMYCSPQCLSRAKKREKRAAGEKP